LRDFFIFCKKIKKQTNIYYYGLIFYNGDEI